MREELVQRISDSCARDVTSIVRRLTKMIEPHCESPIEVMLGAAILTRIILHQACNERDRPWLRFAHDKPSDTVVARLIPQFGWQGYRIDWVLNIQGVGLIFIECDGHEFHERTKEQAARDRQKDRSIQTAGIPILRFTGSEIFADVSGCVDQIMNFAADRLPERKSA